MGRAWLTFWLAFVALSWILSAVLMVAAIAAEDFGRALFLFMLMLANAGFAGIIADARARS